MDATTNGSDYVDGSTVSEFAAQLATVFTETPIKAEDPALGIVERLKCAYAATARCETDADGEHYSSEMYQPLEKRLMETAPTTMVGVAAVIEYVIGVMEMDRTEEPQCFYDALELGLLKSVLAVLMTAPGSAPLDSGPCLGALNGQAVKLPS